MQEHDIAGAAAAGIDSWFVGGGIHAGALGIARDGSLSSPSQTLVKLCQHYSLTAQPTFASAYLQA
jgi:ribonucleotide monophosphatase NagD (HAD superfamily)